MAGVIVPVVSSRLFDFSNLALIGSKIEVVLAHGIDVTEWLLPTLLLRVTGTTDLAGGTLRLIVYCDGTTSEDPGSTFLVPRNPGLLLDSTTPSPSFSVWSFGFQIGPTLRVTLLATRTQATGNIAATFGAEFCLKNG